MIADEGGVEGVAYWCGHRLGYYVAAPGEVQLGALGPVTTLVKCFEVDDEADVTLVFAHTIEHARELFREWNRLAYGDDGESATVEEDVTLAAERASGDAQRGHGHRSDRSRCGLRGRLLAHLPGGL